MLPTKTSAMSEAAANSTAAVRFEPSRNWTLTASPTLFLMPANGLTAIGRGAAVPIDLTIGRLGADDGDGFQGFCAIEWQSIPLFFSRTTDSWVTLRGGLCWSATATTAPSPDFVVRLVSGRIEKAEVNHHAVCAAEDLSMSAIVSSLLLMALRTAARSASRNWLMPAWMAPAEAMSMSA